MDGLVERAGVAVGALADRLEANQAAAARVVDELLHGAAQDHGRALGRQRAARTVLDDRTGLEALSRVDQALPDIAEGVDVLAAVQQQRLGGTARGLPADEASGHDARLVRDQHVTGLQVIDDVPEDAVLDGAVLAMQGQQAAGVARLGGSLGDQVVGQVVVKVIGTHERSSKLAKVRFHGV